MKLQTQLTLGLIAIVVGSSAMAEAKAAAPDYTLSYNVGATSDYRFRGIAQTSTQPALQAGVDFAHNCGLYLGAWGSNISWIKDYVGAKDGSLEIDLYGGYKGAISKDFSYDIGVIAYQYPSNSADKVAGFVNANTTEFYGALTYGLVTAKYSRSTGNFVANTNSAGSGYFELAASFDLGSGYSLTPHVGRQTITNVADSAGDYTDFALTLGKDFGNGVTASLAVISTDAKKVFYTDPQGKFLGDNALVVGVKYSF